MHSYPKAIKRLLREYLAEAHERELHRELTKLDESFAEWRTGAISSGELDHRIHEYKRGPARELYKRYHHGEADLSVAYAIVTGILPEEEMPAELLEALERQLGFYHSWKERNELREPDDWSR
jgi:hypothetical protein